MGAALDVSQRILQAAMRLFFARGFAGTQLRTIASEAGTSESGVLRIYRSKGHLLRVVYAFSWAEINACVDEAIATARIHDDDPRNLLVEIMRTVLELNRSQKPMMQFLLTNFGSPETSGLNDRTVMEADRDSKLKAEYHRYLDRIHDLCDSVARSQPGFGTAEVSGLALFHFVVSVVHGIQVSWYMAEQDRRTNERMITIDEAIAAMKYFLYQE